MVEEIATIHAKLQAAEATVGKGVPGSIYSFGFADGWRDGKESQLQIQLGIMKERADLQAEVARLKDELDLYKRDFVADTKLMKKSSKTMEEGKAEVLRLRARIADLEALWEACLENKEGLLLGGEVCEALNALSEEYEPDTVAEPAAYKAGAEAALRWCYQYEEDNFGYWLGDEIEDKEMYIQRGIRAVCGDETNNNGETK